MRVKIILIVQRGIALRRLVFGRFKETKSDFQSADKTLRWLDPLFVECLFVVLQAHIRQTSFLPGCRLARPFRKLCLWRFPIDLYLLKYCIYEYFEILLKFLFSWHMQIIFSMKLISRIRMVRMNNIEEEVVIMTIE